AGPRQEGDDETDPGGAVRPVRPLRRAPAAGTVPARPDPHLPPGPRRPRRGMRPPTPRLPASARDPHQRLPGLRARPGSRPHRRPVAATDGARRGIRGDMNFLHPRLIAPVLLALTSWLVPAARAQVDETPDSPAAVFLEAWRITKLAFYDPDMRGVDWDAVRDELLPRARAAATPAELSAVINDALSRLKASHTGHYAPHQREYYELLDIF